MLRLGGAAGPHQLLALTRAARPQRVVSMRSAAAASSLITAEALHALRGEPGLAILDASWHMPAAQRNAAEEFAAERIPGSRFVDIDTVAQHDTGLPHMLPSAAGFAAAMDAVGVRQDSLVVVYDRAGIFSSPRLWWMLRAFGHDRDLVKVLDGGWASWVAGAEGGSSLPVDRAALPLEAVLRATAACRRPPPNPRYRAALQVVH